MCLQPGDVARETSITVQQDKVERAGSSEYLATQGAGWGEGEGEEGRGGEGEGEGWEGEVLVM